MSSPDAEARVETALAAIGEARRQLALGEQLLSGVQGLVYERKRLGRLQQQVQVAEHNLDWRREQLRQKGGLCLDEDESSAELA
jgi:hypothetical protein